jgi:lipopolysaccharide biosynthesis glycosyltransferase
MKLPKSLSLLTISAVASILSIGRQWTIIISRHQDIITADSNSWLLLPSSPFPPTKISKNDRRKINGFLPVARDNSTKTATSSFPSKWAYAYLMAGVDVDYPSYLGIFYNILISASILEQHHTKADIVVMVQMSANATSHRLTPREEHILSSLPNVRIYYLDIPPRQSFYTIQMEKFRILEMTEYDRILFLDGDVMPFCSMDYLFELSTSQYNHPQSNSNATHINEIHATKSSRTKLTPLLKENIILAWRIEPAHGGAFILTPRPGDYQMLQDIVQRQERKILAGQKFSKREGWGHVITPPDAWHSTRGREGPNATDWDWHGDFADQGLLYYWTKYVKQDVSIVIGRDVENWSGNQSRLLHGSLSPYGCVPNEHTKANKYAYSGFSSMVPYRDFKHFTGSAKPWLDSGRINMSHTHQLEDIQTAQEYWMYMFRIIQQRFQLQVDVTTLTKSVPITPFGGYPTIQMARVTAQAKFHRQSSSSSQGV